MNLKLPGITQTWSRVVLPGPTASLVLLSQLQPLSRSFSSILTLYVPLVLRDGTSGLTSTGTVTVSVCPCLRGGARAGDKDKDKQMEGEWNWGREAVCLPQQSTLPSPGLSTAALLAILACVATLLGKYVLCYIAYTRTYKNVALAYLVLPTAYILTVDLVPVKEFNANLQTKLKNSVKVGLPSSTSPYASAKPFNSLDYLPS